jgi:hypothetical protein
VPFVSRGTVLKELGAEPDSDAAYRLPLDFFEVSPVNEEIAK